MPICGKHRGVVVDNTDPLGLGRLKVTVPDVPAAGSFALPSVPYAGPGVGFLAIPPVGANVWVEFEAGDPNLPIWTGCFWGPGEAPAADAQTKVFKTDGVSLTWDDQPGGGFKLEVGPPAVPQTLTLHLDANGILITNGQGASISVRADLVDINSGALTVI